MKAHRFFALLVLIASAVWVLTGDFSSVGSATAQTTDNVASAQTPTDDEGERAENAKRLQNVGVATVPSIMHARTIRISGVTDADKITQLTARENGIIDEIAIDQGGLAKSGDVVVRINPEGRDALLESARQVVEQRRTELDARAKLVEQGTLPRLQLDQYISALRLAEADYQAKLAEMERLVVTAPFDGIVDRLLVEEGGAVGSGVGIGTLIALDPIIGRGEVNEADLPIVKVGGSASLRLVDGRIVDGTIRYISRQANAGTRTFSVEVEAPNADLSIPVGMTVEVILKGEPVSAKPLPRSVVTLNDAGELGVRGVDADNRVEFYPIDIVDDSTGALILGGIPDDARLIVIGQNIVGDGQEVLPVAADQAAIDRLIEEARTGTVSQ